MKRLDTMITILTVGALCAVAIPAIAGTATPVTNVTLAKSGDFTEVTVPVPSHQLCDHFTEPATAERPFRIVLNLCNAEHAMPQQNYSNLPACMVSKIRTSQFSTAPESVVRVVLDLKSPATYTVRTESDRLVIAIADKSPAFSMWEANSAPMMAKAEPNVKPVAVEKTQSTAKKETAAKPAPQMAQAAKSEAKTESAPKMAEKPVVNPPASAQPEPMASKPSQDIAFEPTKVSSPKSEMNSTTAPSVTVTMEDLVGPIAKSETTAVPVVALPTEAPVATMAPKANFSLPQQPLVLSPEFLDAATVGNVAMSDPMKSEAPRTMPGFTGNTPQVTTTVGNEAPMLAATGNPATDVTLPATMSSSDTLTGQDALIDRLKAKFFSGQRAPKPYLTEQGILAEQLKTGDVGSFGPPSPGSDMDREALLERIRQATLQNDNIPANMLPSIPGGPVRREVFYADLGRRDPFEPLLKGLRSGFLSDELPSVETLRMVGVLKDDDQALALMEDTDGHSYIMRPGDPVANGRVLSVGEVRTVIQVDEYGWTRTVVLQLTSRGGDPSKTLGANSSSGAEEEAAPPIPE